MQAQLSDANPVLSGSDFIPLPQFWNAPSTAEARVDAVGVGVLGFEELARGSEKIVWRPLHPVSTPDRGSLVYYTPAPSLIKFATGRLKAEKERVDQIRDRLNGQRGAQHLVLDFEELPREQWIKGRYTLATSAANCDLHQALEESRYSLSVCFELGRHFLTGLQALHEIGYVHGDIKPQNCLIFGGEDSPWLKLCDYGKARELKGEDAMYTGNLIYSPPEGRLSLQGDVYSAALLLIRMLEVDLPADQAGIESYIVENPAFPALVPGSLASFLRRIYKVGHLNSRELQEHEDAVHRYISQLEESLKVQNPQKASDLTSICQLLRDMTRSDPDQRPDMNEALERYRQCEL